MNRRELLKAAIAAPLAAIVGTSAASEPCVTQVLASPWEVTNPPGRGYWLVRVIYSDGSEMELVTRNNGWRTTPLIGLRKGDFHVYGSLDAQ